MTQVELVYKVATTIYETENCGGDNITSGEDVSRTNSDFGGGGECRCEAKTNEPGARASLFRPWSAGADMLKK